MNNNYGYGVLTDTDVKQIEYSLDIVSQSFKDYHVNLLEIGILRGHTSRGVRSYLQKIGMTNYSYWAMDVQNVKKPFEECNLVIGKSEESYMLVPDDLHWVFIDGCHCVNHVMLDFLNYGYKIVKGGIIAFHDTSPSAQGNHFQKHGPRIPDFHIATHMAFDKLKIFERSDWQLVSNKYDEAREWGGVAVFQKTEEKPLTIQYYSRERQDRWVAETLKFKKDGYFVDIGAANGITNSNSYALEKYLNWNGICVEPNHQARAFPSLKQNRQCICTDECIFSENGEIDFVARGRKFERSGAYFNGATQEIRTLVNSGKHGTTKCKTITLLELLSQYNAPTVIDYLSIDTEGAEWEILKNFDFSRYTFLTITVENNCADPNSDVYKNERQKRDDIRALLAKHNYKLVKELYFGEDWFVYDGVL